MAVKLMIAALIVVIAWFLHEICEIMKDIRRDLKRRHR